jgi:hypothetical protein
VGGITMKFRRIGGKMYGGKSQRSVKKYIYLPLLLPFLGKEYLHANLHG